MALVLRQRMALKLKLLLRGLGLGLVAMGMDSRHIIPIIKEGIHLCPLYVEMHDTAPNHSKLKERQKAYNAA
jgi:hypothetical protein